MSERYDPLTGKSGWEAFVYRMLSAPATSETELNFKEFNMSDYNREESLPEEFMEKRQSLAEFLLTMATGYSWDAVKGQDDFHSNYMKDADDILRANPHLLGLTTREEMRLDDEPIEDAEFHKTNLMDSIAFEYCEADVEATSAYYKEIFGTPDTAEDDADDVYTDAPEEPSDETLKVMPSQLPVNTLIDDQEYGVFLKDGVGQWFDITNFHEGMMVYDEGPTKQQKILFGNQHDLVDTPADEFFKEFKILAAPLGWEPPGVTYNTIEYFNHETGKMEHKALPTHIPERKAIDD